MTIETQVILALRPLLLAGSALLCSPPRPGRAHAQADLTFRGGSGAPLTLELDAPVTDL